MRKRNCIAFVLGFLIIALVCAGQGYADEGKSYLNRDSVNVSVEDTDAEAPAVEKRKKSSAIKRYLFLRILFAKS